MRKHSILTAAIFAVIPTLLFAADTGGGSGQPGGNLPDVPADIAETKAWRRDLEKVRAAVVDSGNPEKWDNGRDAIARDLVKIAEAILTSPHRESRQRTIAAAKLQAVVGSDAQSAEDLITEGIMWLGRDLQEIEKERPGSSPNPYPQSKDPTSARIEPAADGVFTTRSLDERARLAYETYSQATGGKSAVSGQELPTWDKLNADAGDTEHPTRGETSRKIVDAWRAVGELLGTHVGTVSGMQAEGGPVGLGDGVNTGTITGPGDAGPLGAPGTIGSRVPMPTIGGIDAPVRTSTGHVQDPSGLTQSADHTSPTPREVSEPQPHGVDNTPSPAGNNEPRNDVGAVVPAEQEQAKPVNPEARARDNAEAARDAAAPSEEATLTGDRGEAGKPGEQAGARG